MDAARPDEAAERGAAEAAAVLAGAGLVTGFAAAAACAAFVVNAALPIVDMALRLASTSSRELCLVAACAIVAPVTSSCKSPPPGDRRVLA
jgi:hypothetical protein